MNKNKLYKALIPFLKEANLYNEFQKIIKENKFLMNKIAPFQLAIYLIGKEFGAGNYVPHFTDFEKREEMLKKKRS